MTINRRIAFGAAASWISRGTGILLGLLLLPVLFRHLPREELGVWLLLGQSWATLGILDLGFSPTLTRRIAFAMGKSGADPNAPLTSETIRDIANLVATARRIYKFLAIGAFIVAFGAGFFSLRGLHLSNVSLPLVWMAWGILCLTQAVAVWASVWTCLLQGVGYVGWDALLAAFMNSITLSVQIVVALWGGGLIGLAIAAAVGALIQRFLILALARRRRPELFSIQGSWDPTLVKSMAPLAIKAWVTSLGLAVVLNSDQFFIAGMQGASQIPAYRAAYVVLYNLNLLAVTFALSSNVFVAQLWNASAIERVHKLVTHNLRIGMSIMSVGGACVLALGAQLFDVWIGPGHFIGSTIELVFFLLLILEAQSFIIATSSRATEDEAFVPWTVASAISKIVLSLVLGKRFGLVGIALGTLLSQVFTNHWFMCYRGLRRLRLSLIGHIRTIVAPAALLFGLTFAIVRATSVLLSGAPGIFAVGFSIAVSGLILVTTLWYFVLEHPQRQFAAALPGRLFGFSQR
jgi:O-antigen/teichoic acid export membrane protein